MEVTYNTKLENLLQVNASEPRIVIPEEKPQYTLETRIKVLEEEIYALESEFMEATLEFMTTTNEYDVRVITGISSTMYIPSEFGQNSFVYRIITGEKGRENHDQIDLSTLFDVASITKLFTLILLLKLDDLGYLSLNEKICDINPDFQGLEDFTLNDLMRLHGKYWTDGNVAKATSKEEAERILKTIHLIDNTRKENTYNDFGAIIIADTIAKRMSQVHNRKLTYEYVLKMYLLEPLGMNHTCYNPTTDNVSGNGIGTNIVHDPKARALGGMCGHAGLFTNSTDLMRLARDIFAAMDEKGKVLNKKIVKKLGEETFPYGEHPEKGNLGVYVKTKDPSKDSYVSRLSSTGSFAHQGWTGSLVLFDPNYRIHQSILVNSIYASDKKEQIKNDKPVFYLKALKHYKERVTNIGLKMRYVKNELDLCKNVYEEENNQLRKAFKILRKLPY